MKISYCGHEKTWEVCGSFILLFLLTLALHSTLRPGTSQWDFHLFCSTGDPTYLQWMTRDEKCQSCCSMVKPNKWLHFFPLYCKKKVLKCLRLDNLHSVERKKKYLEGFSQEIRSQNTKKVFFFFFFPSSQVFVRNESIWFWEMFKEMSGLLFIRNSKLTSFKKKKVSKWGFNFLFLVSKT